jgi:HPt (histidine-containing phosphotransfer) domain-containing protein
VTETPDDPLAALRARFLARCQDDLAVLEQALAKPAACPDDALKFTVHRLSGTAGVFGFTDLSNLAAPIDDCLQDHRTPAPESLRALAEALAALL